MDFLFFVNSVLLGVGMAMDAFSVSLANGLNEPGMRPGRVAAVAGVFGVYQTAMPLIGWLCVRTVATLFSFFERLIPWIALVLLLYIGGKMLFDGLRGGQEQTGASALGFGTLMVQGIATSIDAFSVGFTMAEYAFVPALTECVIIGVVTWGICVAGLLLGKTFGTRLAGKATILGGVILIAIGLEIFLTGVF